MGERRWLLRLCMLTVVCAVMIGAVLMFSLQGSSIGALQSRIESHKSELTGMRMALIGLVAYAWPRLLQYAQRSGRISKQRRTELMSLRWRMVGWLLVIELLLGQNLIWRVLQVLDWSGA